MGYPPNQEEVEKAKGLDVVKDGGDPETGTDAGEKDRLRVSWGEHGTSAERKNLNSALVCHDDS